MNLRVSGSLLVAPCVFALVIASSLHSTASALPMRAHEQAPDEQLPAVVVGAVAPALSVERWIKGEGEPAFRPGQIYLLEFFSISCGPCYEVMPHLSELQESFGEKVRVMAVSVREGGQHDSDYSDATRDRVVDFVSKNAERMRYVVGYDGGAKQSMKAWMQAAEQDGVPTAFIIDGAGRIAFIGHPATERCEATLKELVAGTFDMNIAAEKYAARLKDERAFNHANVLFEEGKVDESLAALDALALRSPKWALSVSFRKFQNLIQAKRSANAIHEAEQLLDVHKSTSSGVLSLMSRELLKIEDEHAPRAQQAALRAAQLAVEHNSEKYPGPLSELAAVYWKLGDKEQAIKWQREAVELAPEQWKHNFTPALNEYEGK